MKKEKSIVVLGTVVRIVVDENGVLGDEVVNSAFERAFEECVRIDESFSRFREGNELWRLNQNVGKWVCVSEELFYLIEVGENVRIKSEGAFDLGVKRVLEELGYDRDYGLLENGRLTLSGERVRVAGGIDRDAQGQEDFGTGLCEIQLKKDDLLVKIFREIDLGGIGKGYALDGVRGILEGVSLNNFLIDCGGDIFACGNGWKVAFENPFNFEEAIGSVFVGGFYLASSSGNRRVFGEGASDASKNHHLIDMRTLSSAKNMLATYVQCESGIFADAWATALFVMGFEEARGFLQSCNEGLEATDFQAMIVSNEGEIFRSRGFRGEIFTAFP